MRRSNVTVAWENGLHLRPAAQVVRTVQKFSSNVSITFRGQIANARNILSIVALCAVMGSVLEIEVSGDDEQDAITAIESAFTPAESNNPNHP